MTEFETLKTMLERIGISAHAEEPKFAHRESRKVITIVTGSWGCFHEPDHAKRMARDHMQDIHTMFVFSENGELISVQAYDGGDY